MTKKTISAIVVNVLVTILSITCIFPIIWMAYSSLKSQQEFALDTVSLPKVFRFSNYTQALEEGKLAGYFMNSMFNTVITVLLVLIVAYVTAYCLARFTFRGRNVLYYLFLSGMLIPIYALLIPMFIEFKTLGILNKKYTLILPYIAFALPTAIFLIESYVRGIPTELEEAAYIDGCNMVQTMFMIIMPVCKPVIATSAILTFLHTWNEFPLALVLIRSNNLKTMPIGLTNFVGTYTVNYPLMMAALVISTLPVMIILVLPLCSFGLFFNHQNAVMNRERASTANLNTIEQMGMTLEYIFESVQQNSLFLYQNEVVRNYLLAQDTYEIQQHYMDLNVVIQNDLAYQKYLSAVDLRRLDGQQYSTTSAYAGISDLAAQEISKQSGRLIYMGGAVNSYSDENDAYVFSRRIQDINNLGSTLGMMQLYVRKERIQELFRQKQQARENCFFITEDDTILISSDEQTEGNLLADYTGSGTIGKGKGVERVKLQGREYLISYYHLSYPNWNLVNLMSCEQITAQNRLFLEMLVFTLLLVTAVGGFAAFGLSSYVLGPLKKVAEAMKVIEEEHFHLSVPARGNDEIAVLASSFNKMSTRLDKLVNQVHVAQLSEKNAQIKALQAYINPHFLYNTLDVIFWMSRMEEAWETCRLVEALSKIFRMSVHTGTRVYTVGDNMKNCGYNLITLWPIANAWLAKSSHEWVFTQTRKVLDLCGELGMKAIMQLFGQNQAQEFMPDAALVPDMEDDDEMGALININSIWSNLNHPVVRDYFDLYFKEAITALKDHPAVYGWDVYNEAHFRSDDPYTIKYYQEWLEKKYGDIQQLNRDWYRRYETFSQIRPNKRRASYSIWSSLLPAVEYEKFRSENLTDICRFLYETAKKYDDQHPIIIDGTSAWILQEEITMRNNDEFETACVPDVYGATFYPGQCGQKGRKALLCQRAADPHSVSTDTWFRGQ